jgi:hypothetical protein
MPRKHEPIDDMINAHRWMRRVETNMTRYMKSLKLDGVIVGEYLGSDDTQVDIEAARECLRSKGLYNPPSLVSAMFGQAAAFAYVANGTYGELRKRAPGKPLVAAPFVVNAAFSVELFLKTLHAVATGISPRGHKLVELYDALSSSYRTELCAEAVRLAPEHGEGPQVQFRDLLAMLNDAFERWRYVYELANSGEIHLQQTVLVMHACRDVCAHHVKPNSP